MNRSKRIVSLTVAFFLTLTLCIWVLLTTTLTTVYTPNFISDYMDDNYISAAYNGLMTKWSSYGEPAGIPDKVFKEALEKEHFAAQMIEYTQSVWTGDYSYQQDTEKIGNWLMTAFTNYAAELNIEVDEELQAALNTLRDTCVKSYVSYTSIPLLRTAARTVSSLHKAVLIAIIGVSAILVMLIIVMVRIRHYWFHGMRDVVYTLFAGFLVLAPPAIIVLAANPFTKLNLNPGYLRYLLVNLSNRFMIHLLVFAVLALIAGIVMLVISERKHKEEFHRPKRTPGTLVMDSEEARSHHRHHRHRHHRSHGDDSPRHSRKNLEN